MIKKVNIMRGMLSGWTTEKHLKEKSTMINHRDQHSVAELGSIFASHSSAVYMYCVRSSPEWVRGGEWAPFSNSVWKSRLAFSKQLSTSKLLRSISLCLEMFGNKEETNLW